MKIKQLELNFPAGKQFYGADAFTSVSSILINGQVVSIGLGLILFCVLSVQWSMFPSVRFEGVNHLKDKQQ